MSQRIRHFPMVTLAFMIAAAPLSAADMRMGPWRAVLDCPGGEMPFGLIFERDGSEIRGWIINGPERIDIPSVTLTHHVLAIDMNHYDSIIRATLNVEGDELSGTWKKLRANGWAEMNFTAKAGAHPRFVSTGTDMSIDQTYDVQFDGDQAGAIGVFNSQPDGSVLGTFLTTTGDYRYLSGVFQHDKLRLSCFDGAHAFLFHATRHQDGSLSGDFWSGTHWHQKWTGQPNSNAILPDAFTLTEHSPKIDLAALSFPDTDGYMRNLGDLVSGSKGVLIYIFGTWCPNCHDQTAYLKLLNAKYAELGIRIVGLAFELTGDFVRDAQQVKRYADRHHVNYPLLIAGQYRKSDVAKIIPAIDKLRSYPTTLFVQTDGTIVGVHQGFSGPATGEAFRTLRRGFESKLQVLIDQ